MFQLCWTVVKVLGVVFLFETALVWLLNKESPALALCKFYRRFLCIKFHYGTLPWYKLVKSPESASVNANLHIVTRTLVPNQIILPSMTFS